MLAAMFPRAHTRYESLPLLGGLWEGFCEWLHEQGYPADAIQRRLRVGRKLEDVLRKRRVRSLDRLTAPDLRALVPYPTCSSEQLVHSLVRSLTEYLEKQHRLAPVPKTPIGERVSAYCRYLESVRGLAPSTVVRKGWIAAEFLQFLDYDADLQRLRRLKISDKEAFIAQVGRRLSRASMQKFTATLRSFLRFLAAEGEAPSDLDTYIDSPRCFRGERLPRALPWSSVRSLLRSVDRTTPKGRRDYAMLLMIATYGLRVSEVAALTLDDLSWRSQQIRVPRPKVGTPLLLPLTDEVATALLGYFRQGRAASSHRQVFLRVRKPPGPIESTAVSDAFDVWAARAGIELPKRAGGPHCLRHSLAVHLLRQGASVKTIGDLLGHRSAESTCVYLRLRVEDLRDVALPLPQANASEVQQ
jgi:integrase/recombinase XerD